MFLKSNDRLLSNALTSVYLTNEYIVADVVNSTAHLREDAQGGIDIAGKKFVLDKMLAFQNLNRIFREKLDKSTLLKVLLSDKEFFPLAREFSSANFLMKINLALTKKSATTRKTFYFLRCAEQLTVLENFICR